MIGAHAATLVGMGRYSSKLHRQALLLAPLLTLALNSTLTLTLALTLTITLTLTLTLTSAYSLFYVIGTLGAIRVPPVGMQPLKSLEQMLPLAVFLGMQLLEYVEIQRRKRRLTFLQVWARVRVRVIVMGRVRDLVRVRVWVRVKGSG